MTDLIALAERVEGLQGPDREVDLAVDVLVRPKEWPPGSEKTNPHWFSGEELPAYTASLDAAMTLVPEGWSARVFTGDPTRTLPTGGTTENARPSAEVEEHAFRNGDLSAARWCSSKAATPALALTAACLRARATTPTRTIHEDPTNGR